MRILVTGADGVVGREVLEQLAAHPAAPTVVPVTRTGSRPGTTAWNIGAEAPPEAVRGPWDAIVHMAACTRWTMTRAEAEAANIAPTRAVLDLLAPGTHLVHVSTAYVGGARTEESDAADFDGYRNGYEWSKAECERLVRAQVPNGLTIVRPPLILGRSTDGAISRFSGPYTLLQALVSGLAAVVVGSPDGYAEVAPVDQVAEAIVDAAVGAAPNDQRLEVVAAGAAALRLSEMVDIVCAELTGWRAERGLGPIQVPPLISTESWHRFFLPLAERHLSQVQHEAVRLLGMFESYTSMPAPFEPTRPVADPRAVLVQSVRWWAENKQRAASRTPTPWTMVGASA
ncbi:SDR family oxidoreductase [Micromonospora sp. WMMD1120]|uniref:SDR family oxidoreductase n=1 Tax=Micromonospora sp. WMMD1120 TaxID=3016106 RepID=UPI002415C5C5|nr:SDR family oxidoreductase [Micromonospora sp. WMMD1120]MDG4807574.1 SDR family oxidoreductase [Micromonospora sp. WMMD1120]